MIELACEVEPCSSKSCTARLASNPDFPFRFYAAVMEKLQDGKPGFEVVVRLSGKSRLLMTKRHIWLRVFLQ